MNEPINFQEETSKELQAFKLGIEYVAWLYSRASTQERFTANDVAMFLEMEASEVDESDMQNYKML
jgi:hypothetical protein